MTRRLLRAAAPLLAVGIAVAACAGTSPEKKAKATSLARDLDAAGSAAVPGSKLIKRYGGRALRGELEDGFIVMLDKDRCYTVVGLGDATLRAMALIVTSPTGGRIGKTKDPDPKPRIEVCAKIAGPHRVEIKLWGRGDYVVGLYGKDTEAWPSASVAAGAANKPPPTSAGTSASTGPVAAAGPSAAASAPAAPPSSKVCDTRGAATPFHRKVEGAHRPCSADSDCITIKLDCSHLACTGVHRSQRAAYVAPLDCRGYTGELGNYDCDPQFGIEAPRCRDGCCTSERVGAN